MIGLDTNIWVRYLVQDNEQQGLKALADVHLVVQKKGVADAVLPSKLTTILSAGGTALITAEDDTELGLLCELTGLRLQYLSTLIYFKGKVMNIDFTYWQDNDFFIGFINQYPDYETQGETLDELKENLIDLWKDLESGTILYCRKVDKLLVA